MKKILSFCILSIILTSAIAQVPNTFHFQGALKDSDGVPVNDTKFIEFRIYDAETAGTLLWNEGPIAVEIINGLFSMELGGTNPFPEGFFDYSPLYLTFALPSGEMEPRQKLLSVPFALKAASSDEDWQITGNYIINLNDSIGIGTANPQTRFEVNAIMRLTPSGMTEICDLTLEGSIYYDMNLKEYCFCDGEEWMQLDGGGYCDCVDLDGDGADICDPEHPYDTDGLVADCDDGNSDIYPGNAEYCDGIDNDCDPGTSDGLNEPNFGNSCDGVDNDLCEEGTFICMAGVMMCSDFTGDNEEICDGLDNDCDGDTDEDLTPVLNPNQNGVCAGSYMVCVDGIMVEDYSGIPEYEITEISCDGLDNDCDGEYDEGCTECFGMPDGTPCDDGDPCTENDQCNGEVCQGTPIICAPLDQCHDEGYCDQGNCVYTPLPNGTTCNDENPCTFNDECINGTCNGTVYNCDDGLSCTDDVCNGDGSCTHIIQSNYCVIANQCYINGFINPANPCEECNSAMSQTTWTVQPNGTPCDDGSFCTENDQCNGGNCAGTPITCDDGNACTSDYCDALTGCSHVPVNGIACDDGDACTENDECNNGICQGTPIDCDDSDPSTLDFCNSGSGCYYVTNNAPVASFTANPNPASTGQNITFDASGSYDPDGGDYITTYEWDWDDDGTFDDSFGSPSTSYQFGTSGFYDVTLRVTDSQGLIDTVTLSIQIL